MDPAGLDQLQQVPATPEDILSQVEAQAAISRTLASLTPREERILRMYFGLDDEPAQTLRQIADKFAVSYERVRQIRDKGLRKLMHPARCRWMTDAAETLGVIDPTRRELLMGIAQRRLRYHDVGIAQPRKERPPHQPQLRSPERPPLIPARQTYPDWIALLRLPPEARNDLQKIALAHHLEDVFCARGAGDLIIREQRTWRLTQLRKYHYIMENLHWLWERFPPAPDLATAA